MSRAPLFHACLSLLRKRSKPFIRREERRGEGRSREERRGGRCWTCSGQTSINRALSMGYGIYREQPNAMAINQGLEGQLYQCPKYTTMVTRTESNTHTCTHKIAENRPAPSPDFKAGAPCEQTSSVSNLNILSTSQTRTHEVKLNENITHTITHTRAPETAYIFTQQGVANCF